MQTKEITIALFFAVFICGFVIFITELQRYQESKIPCEQLLSGWHPDVPKKYAEMCAMAREMQKKNVSK